MGGSEKDMLHKQLVKLGDMIGDGLADEPGGGWINREYKKTLIALGYMPKIKRDNSEVDRLMAKRVIFCICTQCQGSLKQTRSGSMRASCIDCGAKHQLLKRKISTKAR